MSTVCEGCGREIIFARITKADGKPGNVPLDPSAPVYRVHRDVDGKFYGERDTDAMVSHFRTCPKANNFSASRSRGRGIAGPV